LQTSIATRRGPEMKTTILQTRIATRRGSATDLEAGSDDDERFGADDDDIEFDLMYERAVVHRFGHST
jgi:hypothetical protein